MTKHIITAAAALLLTFGGAACLPTAEPTLNQHPAIEDNDLGEYFTPAPTLPPVVTVQHGQHVPNVTPPQRLDIAGVERAECDDMGGTFDGAATSGSLGVCVGVDY